jgi:hypothetical protein
MEDIEDIEPPSKFLPVFAFGILCGVLLSFVVGTPSYIEGLDRACRASCADGYSWWDEDETRCICAKEAKEPGQPG